MACDADFWANFCEQENFTTMSVHGDLIKGKQRHYANWIRIF